MKPTKFIGPPEDPPDEPGVPCEDFDEEEKFELIQEAIRHRIKQIVSREEP